MVTGYEADFYRQFATMTKDVHRIAFATEGVVVTLEKLVKQLEENSHFNEDDDISNDNLDRIAQAIEKLVRTQPLR